jgi:pyrroloquinoline-quinone synthase
MQDLVDAITADLRPLESPYLAALNSGELSREDFIETQIQFYFAVVFFSRPMATVAAKIPSQAQRLEVLRNVWEEHGEGEPARFHGTTFLELLRRLDGVTVEDVERRALWPEVRAFNTTLIGAGVVDEYRVGVSVLGMIEHLFSSISAAIGQGIVARGWLPAAQMVHYDLHEQLDVRHAQDFFDVVAGDADDPAHRYWIEQGLWLGGTIFMRLYEDLWRQRGRRWTRDTPGPHGRA